MNVKWGFSSVEKVEHVSVDWQAIRLARQAKQDRILRRIQAACRERIDEIRKEDKP
jgi:hypothetical protein